MQPEVPSHAPATRLPAPTVIGQPAYDLAVNAPGQAAQAKATEILAHVHPFKRWLHRVFGVHTEGEAWRRGALGERMAAAEMSRLGPAWRSLHAIPVGAKGSDIDHLLVGPGGVFTVNTKNHWRSKVWCGGHTVIVNGQKQPYVRNSTYEAKRAAKILSAACGRPIPVRPLLVFVSPPESLTIKRPREGSLVTFLQFQQLRRWAMGLPAIFTDTQVETIYNHARVSDIWTDKPRPARAAGPDSPSTETTSAAESAVGTHTEERYP